VTWRPRRGVAALGALTQMCALDLSDTAVTSAGMGAVARMRGLHTLALSFGGALSAPALLPQRRAPGGQSGPRGIGPRAGPALRSNVPAGTRSAPQLLPTYRSRLSCMGAVLLPWRSSGNVPPSHLPSRALCGAQACAAACATRA